MMALVKPPRPVFVDFPLGHQCGKPNDVSLQTSILRDTLRYLVDAKASGHILDLPYEWSEPFDWESYRRDVDEMLKCEGATRQEWTPKDRS